MIYTVGTIFRVMVHGRYTLRQFWKTLFDLDQRQRFMSLKNDFYRFNMFSANARGAARLSELEAYGNYGDYKKMRNWLSKKWTKLNQNRQNLPFENYLRRPRWPTLFFMTFRNDLNFQNVEFASFYFNRWLPVNGSQIWVGWSRNDFNRCKKIGETFFIPNWEESKTRNSHSRKPIYFGSRLTRTLAVFESRAMK